MKKTIIKKSMYFDSVKLMLVSKAITSIEGVEQAGVLMGTPLNKYSLDRLGLLTKEAEQAQPTDLIIAIEAVDEKSIEKAMVALEEELYSKNSIESSNREYRPRSLDRAYEIEPDANMLIISVPGSYAANLAKEGLKKNMHVMLFSDNVSLEDELELKKMAKERDLLIMGPDCGTAHINGIPLCFSNVVKRGSVGIVGASGTGTQEIMTLLDKHGVGISQAIGIGGRDLKREVGGISTIEAIKALDNDNSTEIIVIVSKPPAEEIAQMIIGFVKEHVKKPVVVNFLGYQSDIELENIYFEDTLEKGAKRAAKLCGVDIPVTTNSVDISRVVKVKNRNKCIKGLFSGGSLAYECLFMLESEYSDVKSNLSKKNPLNSLDDLVGNITIDFGEDEFTRGRPHPMIDSTLRAESFKKVLGMEDSSVIVMDFMLGYGSNIAPHSAFIDIYNKTEKGVPVVVNVCGTKEDPQDFDKVVKELENAGFIVANSNASAVISAIKIAKEL